MQFDLKSMIFCAITSAAAGGGLYGLYVKTLGEAAFTQAEAYGYIAECVLLLQTADAKQINTFFKKMDAVKSKLAKSDLTVTLVNKVLNGGNLQHAGMGTPLTVCQAELNSKLELLNRPKN